MTTLALNDKGDVTASFEAKVTGYEGKELVARWSVAGKEFEQVVDGDGKAFTAHSFAGITPWSPEVPQLYDMKVELLSVAADGSRRIPLNSPQKRALN